MAVVRPEKTAEVEKIRESWGKSTATVLLDFAGVNVGMVTDLRARFRKEGVEYRVVKNKLIVQALRGTPLEGNAALSKHLKGMTGVAWSFEDPSAAAKIIKAFRKENEQNEKLTVKCGVIDADVMEGPRVEAELATMPGKNELRGMLLATMQAPAQSLVRQLNAAAQNFTYLLDARKRQQEGA